MKDELGKWEEKGALIKEGAEGMLRLRDENEQLTERLANADKNMGACKAWI